MARFTNPLKHVRVAAPCSADWNQMSGNERVRFCGQCERNVYNLSDMTRREAERLVKGAEGRLCIRFYRRADGTILTNNCPVGLRALKRRASRIATAALSTILSFFGGLGIFAAFSNQTAIGGATMGAAGERRQLPVIMGGISAPREREATQGEAVIPVAGTMAYEPPPSRQTAGRVRRARTR